MNKNKDNLNNDNLNNDNLNKDKTKLYCINCGKLGHISKQCLCPIISIGIICIKLNIEDLDINTIISFIKIKIFRSFDLFV
jgi:hypothetical protein